MSNEKLLFYKYLAQTSKAPLALEIEKANGAILTDTHQKEYIDFISGISVSNIGHCHPKVVEAVKNQVDKYMHLMVYGEYVQSPQVLLAEKLVSLLPAHLNNVYFVNSGAEAIEGALKLSKKYTGRNEIISFKNAYHGSTHGALSIMGNELIKNCFRPLLPGVKLLTYNNFEELVNISRKTACVVVEAIQAEAGIIEPENGFLSALEEKCKQNGALLVVDEIQTGLGRTGHMFGFENYNIKPDIITLAKGLGAGMPLGAFISSEKLMSVLKSNPALGHITTFGGHPVSCAAALAGLDVIIDERLTKKALEKHEVIQSLLELKDYKLRGKGLFLALKLKSAKQNLGVIDFCLKRGLITDWFLFADDCLRIAPPLNISIDLIHKACLIILEALENEKN
ncbi:MAG: aspartate aminotransferase family protein [Bacteroidales bacterium]|nr:aspartate aminotransferase family protein [Bacteroidales bacterium]